VKLVNLGINTVSGGALYNYGYPAYGAVEPNVIAQWLFDEPSGNIVDEVGAVTLTANGTPTYGVVATGDFAGISPGIFFPAAASYFSNTSTAAINIGTDDFVVEFWFKKSDGSVYYIVDNRGGGKGWAVYFDNGTTTITLRIIDAFDALYTFTCTSAYNDGGEHKLRLVVDRSANAELFLDGVSMGTNDISATAAFDLSGNAASVNSLNAIPGSYGASYTIYELRVSKNLTNNSGGPGGG
jgi:hypothetical protein